LQRKCACGGAPGVDGACETCREGGAGLQRRAAGPGGPATAPPIVNDVLRSPGQPLNTATRAFFEPRLGHDFSKVRVHHDPRAATSARAVNALAYTVGSDVVFDTGRYAPDTSSGRSLIAHELTHVVQQRTVSTDLRSPIQIGSSTTVHEREADRIASGMSSHGPGAGRDVVADPTPVAVPQVSRLAAADAHLQRAVMGETFASRTSAPGTSTHSLFTTGLGLLGQPVTGHEPAAGSKGKPAPPPAPPRTPAASPVQAPPPAAPAAPPAKEKTAAAGPAPTPQDQAKHPEQPGAPAAAAPATAAAPAAATAPTTAPTTAPAPAAAAGDTPRPPAGGKPADSKGPGAAAAEAPAGKAGDDKTAGPKTEAGEGAVTAKKPVNPKSDPHFQAMTGRVKQASTKLKSHAPAAAKANEAQAAAVSPPAELKGRASAAQAAAIDQTQPKPFDRASFIDALMKKIASIAPKTLSEADDFKESGKVASVKGDLSKQADASKTQAQGDIPGKVQQAPDPSGIPPKPVTPLPATDAGPPPPNVNAAAAVPQPAPDSEVSLKAGSDSLDHQMAAANVTEKQLTNSNEPAFQQAADAKSAAQADAVKEPQAFRQGEKATIGQASTDAQATAVKQLQTMHGSRGQVLDKVAGHQSETKTQDEQARADVAQKIQSLYDAAKTNTENRLKQIDTDVDAAFEKGATEAQTAFDNEVDTRMTRYKDDRYGGFGGGLLWAKDKLLGMPDEVNAFYEEARQNYIQRMTGVLNVVAGIVETGLNEAKAFVAEGRKSIDDYLTTLPKSLQAVGKEAAQGIQAKFDELEHSVDDKQGALIDSLAQKYTEKLQQIDDKIAAMKQANAGLVDAAISAVAGVIKTIINLKNMLLNVLAKASAAIDLIIADPIGFLGNLVAAVKKGFMGFVGKIGMYIEQGLIGWLFGALAEAGIEMPKSFDLKGIIGLILQVLGLTYANIRARAVKILGPKVVEALETGAEIFKTLITEGPAGLWKWIKDKVSALKDAAISSIKDFVISKVITAGVTWILSLLNPASAFIKACKAIYDVVMFFVERGAQIMALVNAILDSIISIAKGDIAGAAAYVESVLAKSVPVVISFLASLLGLGGISEKIKAILEKIREPINAAIDWVINLAVSAVKAVGKLLGFGKEKEKDQKEAPSGVKALALQKLEERVSANHTAKKIKPILGQILDELRPQGLSQFYLSDVDESGSYSVMAAASELKDLRQFVPGDRTVIMATTITLSDESSLEDILGKDKPYIQVPSKEARSVTKEARELDPIRVTGKDVGGTPSGGYQFRPEKGSRELQLLTWNTTQKLSGKNVSHAEKQFVNWLRERIELWGKIRNIDIHITHSPCGTNYTETCTIDLAELMPDLRKKNPGVHGHIMYESPFTKGKNATTEADIKKLIAAGWTVDGPQIIDDDDQPLDEQS